MVVANLILRVGGAAAVSGLAAGSGMGAAIFLQSSTAVAVLASNFVAKGNLTAAVGLAILLGADFGSAVVSQLLLLRQDYLTSVLLLLGLVLFLRGSTGNTRQIGRMQLSAFLLWFPASGAWTNQVGSAVQRQLLVHDRKLCHPNDRRSNLRLALKTPANASGALEQDPLTG